MYQKEEIEQLARKYVETQEEEVFEALINQVKVIINLQLNKSYGTLFEFWDDLRQEVIINLWKNRGGLSTTKSVSYTQYFYFRIRRLLNRNARKIRKQYDSLKPNVVSFDDLSLRDKQKFGIDTKEEDYD